MLALFDELLGLKEFTEGLVQKAWKIMEAIILPNLTWRGQSSIKHTKDKFEVL